MSVAGDENRVTIQILGDEFVFRGTAPAEHLQRLAAEVDRRMRQLVQQHPTLSRHRLALLVALHLADELERLKTEYDQLLRLLEDVR